MNRFLSFTLALVLPLSVWAHGGEDHGEASALAPITSAAPRISTNTDQFELVGVLEGKVFKVYLDQFGTNTPVPKAQIEIESGSWKAVATEIAPAVYSVSAELLAQPGKHPLAITVQAADDVDLMNATLEVGQTSAANAGTSHAHFWGEWAVWAAATVLSMAALGLVFIRRRKQSRRHSHL